MAYTNNNGQARVGVRIVPQVNASSLWNSIYSVYNADTIASSSLKTSLVASYNGESNANDSFGSTNGTAQGGLTYGTGKIGNAFQFNGTTAYVGLPDNSLNLTGDFTISAWVYPTAGTPQSILNNLAYTNGTVYKGWQLDINNVSGAQSYKVTFTFGQGPGGSNYTGWEYSTTALTPNAWNHILIKRVSGVNTYCWINNISQSYVLFGTGANITTNPTYHTTQYVTIGSYKLLSGAIGSYLANGSKVDGVTVWNKALTDDERAQIYNSGNGAQYITDNFYKPTTNDALNTYNGTAQGGLTYGVGKVGTAFQFNGTNAYVQLPNNSMNFNTDFSISVWSNFQGISGVVQSLISNLTSNGSNAFGFLMYYYNHDLTFQISNNSGNTLLAYNTSALVNSWKNIVVTRKASTGTKIYIDGVLVASNLDTRNPSYAATMTPSIGAANYGPTYSNLVQYYCGNNTKLDEIGVWNKELTATEVTELYNSGNGKQYPN